MTASIPRLYSRSAASPPTSAPNANRARETRTLSGGQHREHAPLGEQAPLGERAPLDERDVTVRASSTGRSSLSNVPHARCLGTSPTRKTGSIVQSMTRSERDASFQTALRRLGSHWHKKEAPDSKRASSMTPVASRATCRDVDPGSVHVNTLPATPACESQCKSPTSRKSDELDCGFLNIHVDEEAVVSAPRRGQQAAFLPWANDGSEQKAAGLYRALGSIDSAAASPLLPGEKASMCRECTTDQQQRYTRRPPMLSHRILGSTVVCGPFHAHVGDAVEVLSHNELTHTVVIRNVSELDTTVPEVALLCPGERARGTMMLSTCHEPRSPGPSRQIFVASKSLVRIVGERHEFYEVDIGYRGFIPRSIVQVGDPDLDDTEQMQRVRKMQAACLLSGRGGNARGTKAKVDEPAMAPPSSVLNRVAADLMYEAPECTSPDWTFGAVAYDAALFNSVLSGVLGLAGFSYSFHDRARVAAIFEKKYDTMLHMAITLGTVLISIAIFICHYALPTCNACRTLKTPLISLFRAVVMLGISAPLYLTWFTLLPAVCYSCIGLLYGVAAFRGEVKRVTSGRRAQVDYWHNREEYGGSSACKRLLTLLCDRLFGGSISRAILALVWLITNGVVFGLRYASTASSLKTTKFQSMECWGEESCEKLYPNFLTYIPIAKACGRCINVNGALLLLLACQSVLHKLSDFAHRDSAMAVFFRWVPTHKSMVLHKFVSAALFIFIVAHVWAHFMAQTFTLPTYSRSIPFYGSVNTSNRIWVCHSIWITGGIMVIAMIFMYAASTSGVRSTMYETFTTSHVAGMLVLMVCVLWHAPSCTWYIAIPLALYLFDDRRKSKAVCPRLLEVQYSNPVLTLVFSAPWKYRSGEHVWLHCPSLSKHEWRPFYISSAFESDVLTLRITTRSGGWTEDVRFFIGELVQECEKVDMGTIIPAPHSFRFRFDTTDWITGECSQGKSTWKGVPLFLLDGPHPGPATHYENFETVFFVSAGLGLPPMDAVLRQVTEYRWREGSGNTKPANLYCAWMCPEIEAVPDYRWFLNALSDYEVLVRANQDGSTQMQSFHYEMHLFMASAKEQTDSSIDLSACKPKPTEVTMHDTFRQKVLKPFDADDLLNKMSHPSVSSRAFLEIMSLKECDRSNSFGNTSVWCGQPDWDHLLARIRNRHGLNGQRHRVGIFFCGCSKIARGLALAASKNSNDSVKFQVINEVLQ